MSSRAVVVLEDNVRALPDGNAAIPSAASNATKPDFRRHAAHTNHLGYTLSSPGSRRRARSLGQNHLCCAPVYPRRRQNCPQLCS